MDHLVWSAQSGDDPWTIHHARRTPDGWSDPVALSSAVAVDDSLFPGAERGTRRLLASNSLTRRFLSLADVTTSGKPQGVHILGASSNDQTGIRIAGAGDFDGDAALEIALSLLDGADVERSARGPVPWCLHRKSRFSKHTTQGRLRYITSPGTSSLTVPLG